jgi:hypothetical protein
MGCREDAAMVQLAELIATRAHAGQVDNETGIVVQVTRADTSAGGNAAASSS